MNTIMALEEVRRCCEDEQPLTDELRTWLATSIEKFLTKKCNDLDQSFGIVQGHGGIPWWLEDAIRKRDDALRTLAATFLSELSVSARAREIERMAKRYETTCWPRDRACASMPAHYAGKPQELLWTAFRSRARMPVSERHLRTLIQGANVCRCAA